MSRENKHVRPWSVWFARVFVFLISALFTVSLIELTARWLTEHQHLSYYKPIESKVDPNTEDWRWTHTFNDDHFVPDSRLFWKPKINSFPFDDRGNAISEQFVSYRTPDEAPKILVYGDSNTQGLVTNSWANELQLLLLSARIPTEVMNRGVVGYSSYQGVERLKQDLEKYTPKIIIFAFGWNDTAPSVNAPDPFYRPYPTFGGNILANSRAYSVGVYYLSQFRTSHQKSERANIFEPRVSKEQYIQELEEMYTLAERHGAAPIIMTRPYDITNEGFHDSKNWRSTVPEYNEAVRQFMRNDPAHFIDLEAYFSDQPELILDEGHLIPEGHRKAARLLFDHMAQYHLL